MKNVSRYSRRIVVLIFSLLTLFLIFSDIYIMARYNTSESQGSVIFKLAYIILIMVITAMYMTIKSKFSRKSLSKRISITYRYIFLIVLTIFSKLFYLNNIGIDFEKKGIVLTIIALNVFIAICIKKIIYNVSKSDVLSIIGMIGYALYPIANTLVTDLIRTYLTVFIVLMIIMYFYKIIDELKQIGIKNKKYIKYSILIAIFIGVSMCIGVNSLAWVITGISTFFITCNLDMTHINFPNKVISNVKGRNRERLYKLERMNINKIYISLCIIAILSYFIYYISRFVMRYIVITKFNNEAVYSFLTNYMNNNVFFNLKCIISNFKISNIATNLYNVLENSNIYYLILFIYNLFIEIITFLLQRSYDTKTCTLKVLFICIFIIVCINGNNIFMYNMLLISILQIISIINTSNIYLNRDERVKLLNARN